MPAPKDIDFYENPFGYELRRHRLRSGLSQVQLAKDLGYNEDTISKIETGVDAPSVDFAHDCDTMFGTHGMMKSLAKLVRRASAFPKWFRWWAEEIEPKARTLRSWQPLVVDGLLQTAGYARGLLRLAQPGASDERIDEQMAARLERQTILDRDDPPVLWVALHEHVLRCEVGSPEIMREQLQFLLHAAEHPNISIRVVPLSAGMPAGHLGAFAVASLDDSPDVVYLENARAGQVIDRQEDVHEIMNTWEAIREEALPARASLDLIAKVMEQWT